MANLSSAGVSGFSTAQIGELSTAQIGALSRFNIGGLTATQIATLSTGQIGAINAAAAPGLTAAGNRRVFTNAVACACAFDLGRADPECSFRDSRTGDRATFKRTDRCAYGRPDRRIDRRAVSSADTFADCGALKHRCSRHHGRADRERPERRPTCRTHTGADWPAVGGTSGGFRHRRLSTLRRRKSAGSHQRVLPA